MKLPKQAIEEFKEIYKRQMKVDLTDEEAELYANSMMRLMILAQPIPFPRIRDIFIEENKKTTTSHRNRTSKKLTSKSKSKKNKKS